jgi:hypothetical protein
MTAIHTWKNRIYKAIQSFKKKPVAAEISFFDVKVLYNEAYEHKAKARLALRQYRRIEAQARAMDQAYRSQLGGYRRAA